MVAPPPRWYKLNFDGASHGNPGQSGIGCIINNEKGKWIIKRAKNINPTSNNLAEIEALQEGIKLCHKIGLTKVIIEGDSQIVLNTLRKRSTPNWVLNSKLEEILSLIDKLEVYQITHIFRQGNQIANELANLGVDGSDILRIKNFS